MLDKAHINTRVSADTQSERASPLSPWAKRVIWRMVLGLVVALIIIAINQN